MGCCCGTRALSPRGLCQHRGQNSEQHRALVSTRGAGTAAVSSVSTTHTRFCQKCYSSSHLTIELRIVRLPPPAEDESRCVISISWGSSFKCLSLLFLWSLPSVALPKHGLAWCVFCFFFPCCFDFCFSTPIGVRLIFSSSFQLLIFQRFFMFSQNYNRAPVMALAVPVAVKFLQRGNKELCRNMSSYLSLAAIAKADLLAEHTDTIVKSVLQGRNTLRF